MSFLFSWHGTEEKSSADVFWLTIGYIIGEDNEGDASRIQNEEDVAKTGWPKQRRIHQSVLKYGCRRRLRTESVVHCTAWPTRVKFHRSPFQFPNASFCSVKTFSAPSDARPTLPR